MKQHSRHFSAVGLSVYLSVDAPLVVKIFPKYSPKLKNKENLRKANNIDSCNLHFSK